MRKTWLRIGAVLLWLVMVAWLVRYEAFPDFFTHSLAGYRAVVPPDVLLEDSWMRILYNGAPIGYSHTGLEMNEGDLVRRYAVNNRTELKLNLLGEARRIHTETVVRLDAMHNLQDFAFEMSSGSYSVQIRGFRREGRAFDVLVKTREGASRSRVEIPDDVVIYSPVLELAMKRMKPGQEISVRTLDPVTLETSPVIIRALRREPLSLQGTNVSSLALSSEYRGLKMMTWVDAEGRVLKQDTPFGWVLERCSSDDAMEAIRGAGEAGDLLKGMAVRLEGRLRNPEGSLWIRYRLSGADMDAAGVSSVRQVVERAEGGAVDLKVMAAAVARPQPRDEPLPEACRPFLAATSFVQADHPDIVRKAEEIVGSRSGPLQKAVAIHEWVYRNVKKEITVSLPSALDVLRTMKGDCNEHTYLFVALARAAGVPARIEAGVVYRDGVFYYHAWPAVFAGAWMEMDPTLGQLAVDATHIALAEGEIASQMELLKVMGRLKIEVLEESGP